MENEPEKVESAAFFEYPKDKSTFMRSLANRPVTLNRWNIAGFLARGERDGVRLTDTERDALEYAADLALRLNMMGTAMSEFCDLAHRVRSMHRDFLMTRDPAHLDEALRGLENKIKLADVKRREIMGIY
jgi:hypothetical protein